MDNHIYKFADTIRKQENEGGIGVELTGVLSEFKMPKWNKIFNEKLEKANVINDMNDRYVDDHTLIPTILPRGSMYDGNKVVRCENQYIEDEGIEKDFFKDLKSFFFHAQNPDFRMRKNIKDFEK